MGKPYGKKRLHRIERELHGFKKQIDEFRAAQARMGWWEFVRRKLGLANA